MYAIYRNTCVCIYLYIHLYIYTHTFIHEYSCYTYIYICVHMCMYVYIYIFYTYRMSRLFKECKVVTLREIAGGMGLGIYAGSSSRLRWSSADPFLKCSGSMGPSHMTKTKHMTQPTNVWNQRRSTRGFPVFVNSAQATALLTGGSIFLPSHRVRADGCGGLMPNPLDPFLVGASVKSSRFRRGS